MDGVMDLSIAPSELIQDRSSLKLTLQIKDSQYTIKETSNNSDQESSDHESVDEANFMMDSNNTSGSADEEVNPDELKSASFIDDFETNGELSNNEEDRPDVGKPDTNDVTSNTSIEQLTEIESPVANEVPSNTLSEQTSQIVSIDNDELSNTSFFEEDNKRFVKTEPDKEDLSDTSRPSENSFAQVNDKDDTTGASSSSSVADDKTTPPPNNVPASTSIIKLEKPENGKVPENKAPNGGNASDKDDGNLSDAETEIAPHDEERPPTQPLISVRKTEDLMMSRVAPPQMNGANEECNVCCERFPSPAALEQHRAAAGHFSCNLSPECGNLVFPTPADLGQHQAMAHQPPVQQLAQQVQRIPVSFTSPTYRPTSPQHQRNNIYMTSSQMVQYYPGAMMAQDKIIGGSVPTQQQIGSGVVLSTVPSTPSVPNLPPGIQLSKRPAMQPPQASSPKQRREEDSRPGIRLPDSITLVKNTTPTPPKKDSVTDMLANRGITVVPSGRSSSSPQQPSSPVIPRSLMNTSAISITPSSQTSPQHRSSNFAVPQKPVSRVLTVDLTKEADTPPRRSLPPPNRGGRLRGPTGRSVCQICDKAFPTPQELSQHMACHRGGGAANKLAYECRECTAQYPTEAGLQAHRLKYHGAGGPSPDMAIPVVDLKQNGVMSRLAALGIRTVIPLAQLHSSGQGSAMFALPVVAVDSASNPAICNIGGLGASNLLPLGPLKNLSYQNNMR